MRTAVQATAVGSNAWSMLIHSLYRRAVTRDASNHLCGDFDFLIASVSELLRNAVDNMVFYSCV